MHWLHARVSVTAPAKLCVGASHAIVMAGRHRLLHVVPYLGDVTVPSAAG